MRDFWRRWHMSLSTWLRDYLYIPLGGSRGGRLATYRNILLTMVLGGLWHGAAWTFVIWGTLHGLALTLERAAADLFSARGRRVALPRIVAVLLTFHFVCACWIFFRADSLATALTYFAGLADWTRSGGLAVTPFLLALIVVPLGLQFVNFERAGPAGLALLRTPIVARAGLFALALIAITFAAPEGTAPFIYFRF